MIRYIHTPDREHRTAQLAANAHAESAPAVAVTPTIGVLPPVLVRLAPARRHRSD